MHSARHVVQWAALAAALAAVAAWGAGAGALPDIGLWADVAVTVLVLFPVTFSVALFALPLARWRGLLLLAVAFGALAWVLYEAGADAAFNAAKLLAYVFFGYWFMELFEELWWIVLVAAVIPWVDALSVWQGPTKVVVEERPGLFDRVSIEFRLPGESGTANIGPPDIAFFALFLAAADRFGLRVYWTFVAMLGFLGLTVALTAATDRGLPALPAVAIGFLVANADLVWRHVRAARAARLRED